MCVCTYVPTHVPGACVEIRELFAGVGFLHHMDSWGQTQVIVLGKKHPYPLSHPPPRNTTFNKWMNGKGRVSSVES